MAWTPPKNDRRNVGAFVAENYGKKSSAFQQRLYRKLLGKGYEYYRKDDSSPYTRVTSGMKMAKPDGWGTGTNIIGGWDDKPNLDSSQYEIGQNAVGRYYARPHDIKNYLDGAQNGLIRAFEEKASAANVPVEKAYGDYEAAAKASATQIGAQNKAAQDLIAKTYSGAGTSGAEAAATNDAASYATKALPEVNAWAAMPTVAAQNKANALASVKQTVDDARREMLMAMYSQVQEERMAKARNAAEIRVAQMQNLAEAKKLAQQGDQFNRELAQNLTIARENNATDLAQTRVSAASSGSSSSDSGTSAKDYKKWRSDLAKRMKGTKTSTQDTEYMVPGFHKNGGDERTGWAYVDDAGYLRWSSDDTVLRDADGNYQKMPGKAQTKDWQTRKSPVQSTTPGSQTGWSELFVEGLAEGFTAKQVAAALYVANPSLRKLPKSRFANALYQRLKGAYGAKQAATYVRAVVPGWKG